MDRLKGKVAIVTGGGQGIGKGIVLKFAKEGAKVCIAELNPKTAEEAAEEIRKMGFEAIGVVCDVGKRESVNNMVAECVKKFGTVNILVNNAMGYTQVGGVETLEDRDFDIAYQSGLKGSFYCCQAVLPYMEKNGGGKIINMGSGMGIMGLKGTAGAAAAKEGIRAFTRVTAREWGAYNICLNVINPFADSPASRKVMEQFPEEIRNHARSSNPLGRIGDPENDIGGVALFLACEDSDFVTGQTINVDGGNVML